jgi:predicted transcriptional regulator
MDTAKKGAGAMQSAKEEVMELLKQIPDNTSLEEIQYHLYVRQKIQKGIKDIEAGRIYSQEEVEKRMEKWNVK